MIKTQRARRSLLFILAYLTFVTFGLSEGLLGVGWPSIRTTFGLSFAALGALLTAFTVGYLLSTFTSGRVTAIAGIGVLLAGGNLLAGIGFLGYALAPSWEVMVGCGFLVGIGVGVTEAGLNTHIAMNHSARVLSWSHASFGLGATVGPMIMTAILSLGSSWRYGYALLAALKGLLGAWFGLTLGHWKSSASKPSTASAGSERHAGISDTLRLPIVWLGIILFFLHTGIELTAGQWAYTLFTEARYVDTELAGIWLSIYWGSLTASRLLIGVVSDHISKTQLVRVCLACVTVGSILLWLNPTTVLSFLGLAAIGFCLAPVFPMLISISPKTVGSFHAPNAIGFQVAAAALGGAVFPGLAGVLAARLGLEAIGPFLVMMALLMVLVNEVSVRCVTPPPSPDQVT